MSEWIIWPLENIFQLRHWALHDSPFSSVVLPSSTGNINVSVSLKKCIQEIQQKNSYATRGTLVRAVILLVMRRGIPKNCQKHGYRNVRSDIRKTSWFLFGLFLVFVWLFFVSFSDMRSLKLLISKHSVATNPDTVLIRITAPYVQDFS